MNTPPLPVSFCLALCATILLSLPLAAFAQSTIGKVNGEVVADLAAGRVVIAVVKDAILVGTLENPIEVHTLPPTPVLLSSERFGVFLGPADWWSPPGQREIAALDQELPRLRTYAVAMPPHLGRSNGGDQPKEIEMIGQSLQQRLDQLAESLHGPLNLPPDDPFAQLVVADYFAGYGPEIWRLSYKLDQEQQSDNFWTSGVERPTYLQFYPPEKGQPRTIVEFDYPADNPPPSVLDLLRQQDSRVQRVVESDPTMRDVAQHFLDGTSNKVRAADATQFLRAVLDAIAPPHARETVGILHPETGFNWILAPPPEAPAHREKRPTGAPTLQPD
ncbi:MAG TPA: hypothetical protein VNK23_13475 [Candidatus Dormibacteraeota bacterium]|nr:hypothetical protein [Candidatus Dormibacteraeota bacterium]